MTDLPDREKEAGQAVRQIQERMASLLQEGKRATAKSEEAIHTSRRILQRARGRIETSRRIHIP